MKKKCISCGEEFEGRVDKIYCTTYCKSNYHYQRRKYEAKSFYKKIDDQLRLNRRLLHHYNRAGKSTIRSEKLMNSGFNPRIFTHYWKTKAGRTYFFCYDQGFQAIEDNGRKKYSLIHWQEKFMTIGV